MSAASLIYLITGASRGIGRAYAEALLKKTGNITVIAAVRDVSGANAKSLEEAEIAPGNKLVTVKIDSIRDDDAAKAVEQLKNEYNIDRLDVSTPLLFSEGSHYIADLPSIFLEIKVVVHNAGAVLEW